MKTAARSMCIALAVASCTACTPEPLHAPTPTSSQVTTEMSGDKPPPPPPPVDPNADAPEISRSGGVQGGIVILFPRVSGKGDDGGDVAGKVQRKLLALAQKVAPGAPTDVRPEPERVCPRPNGCAGAALGAIVRRNGKACAVVALVSGAGASPQRVVGWVGAIKADALTVPFREPPEPHVKLTDYASCAKLDEALEKGSADVEAAIRAALPR